MDYPLNRRDIGYTIISRFETIYRTYVAERIATLFPTFSEGVPEGILEKAKTRGERDDWEDASEFLEDTDFPDLAEIVLYQDSFSRYFPNLGMTKEQFRKLCEALYDLRCKIAHVKGYFNSLDLDRLLETSRILAPLYGESGKRFIEFVEELERSPEKLTIRMPLEFTFGVHDLSAVPNNVPTPDYEYEGGFVGREEDVRRVLGLLQGDLHRVITISGAGGVGKTALALRVIHQLLRSLSASFDGIVWSSAKETKLSYVGIEEVEPTIKSYEELLDTISEVMGFGNPGESMEKKESDVQTIFDLYDRVLIVIDNLETVTDERIINFILDAHPHAKILITSRKGLGQVERRYELKQLKEREAIYLFRQVAKDKRLMGLVSLSDDIIKAYVEKVSYYPLAIKWVLGQVALGKGIDAIVDVIGENTSDISHFCFDQIFGDLSDPAKKILCALSCFDDSPSAGVLNYVVNIGQHDFEDGIRELIIVSLVIPEQYVNEQNEVASRFALLSLTRGFVRQQLDKDSLLKRNIEERLRTVQATVEEAERAKKQYRFSLSNLGATTEEEKVAAMMAQTAFQKYQAGRYIDALDDYRRACEIAPRFASLYRNWAVMESQEGHVVEADKLMEKAAKLSPDDPQIWLTWGNIKRKSDKVKEALEKYEMAHELSPDDSVIMNALGQAKCRLGEYAEADQLFRKALQAGATGSSIRHEIINRSSLADNLARWAEGLFGDRNYGEAEKKLIEALEHCRRVVSLDKNDPKSLDLLRHVLKQLGFYYKKHSKPEKAVEYFKQAIVERPVRFREAQDTIEAALQAGRILHNLGRISEAKEVFSPRLLRIGVPIRKAGLQERLFAFYRELYPEQEIPRERIPKHEPERVS